MSTQPGQASRGMIAQPREGKVYQALGMPITLKATGEDTGGSAEVLETVFSPGSDFPAHSHRTYDEAFYILEGEITVRLGDRTTALPAGSFGFAPRGSAHGFKNTGTRPCRMLMWQTPAYGMRQMLEEMSALPPGPPDLATLGAIFQKYDITPAAPPPGH